VGLGKDVGRISLYPFSFELKKSAILLPIGMYASGGIIIIWPVTGSAANAPGGNIPGGAAASNMG